MSIIEAFQLSKWQPQIGDPSMIGWVTVGLYVLAFLFSLRAIFKLMTQDDSEEKNRIITFFIFFSFMIFFLGVNKQLDLQTLFTDVFRILAKHEGWYAERKYFQKKFIIFIIGFGTVSFLLLAIWLRSFFKRLSLLLLGFCLLMSFILIRAASLHYMDGALRNKLGDFKIYAIIEVSSLLVILCGILLASRVEVTSKLREFSNDENNNDGWHKFGK